MQSYNRSLQPVSSDCNLSSRNAKLLRSHRDSHLRLKDRRIDVDDAPGI